MPKRSYADFSHYQAGRTGMRRLDAGAARYNESKPIVYRYGRSRRTGGVPSRYSGSLRRSGYYGRYTRSRQVARARQGLQIEKKFFDTTLSFSIDATGEVPASGQLCLIPQGVTESTRVGRKCVVKSLQIHAEMVYTPAADTVGSASGYILLVQDKQCNGAAASATDVMTTSNFQGAMLNLANSERFRILRRWSCVFQAGAGVQGAFGQDRKIWDVYLKLNMPLEFSSTTGAITELKSNNIFLLASSDGSLDDAIAVAGTCRIRFTDL